MGQGSSCQLAVPQIRVGLCVGVTINVLGGSLLIGLLYHCIVQKPSMPDSGTVLVLSVNTRAYNFTSKPLRMFAELSNSNIKCKFNTLNVSTDACAALHAVLRHITNSAQVYPFTASCTRRIVLHIAIISLLDHSSTPSTVFSAR